MNALNCSKSHKQIKNKSVYCMLLDQYVSINYCENACRAYELKKNEFVPKTEKIIDSSGVIRNEEGITDDEEGIVDDTKENEESLMRLGENEE